MRTVELKRKLQKYGYYFLTNLELIYKDFK